MQTCRPEICHDVDVIGTCFDPITAKLNRDGRPLRPTAAHARGAGGEEAQASRVAEEKGRSCKVRPPQRRRSAPCLSRRSLAPSPRSRLPQNGRRVHRECRERNQRHEVARIGSLCSRRCRSTRDFAALGSSGRSYPSRRLVHLRRGRRLRRCDNGRRTFRNACVSSSRAQTHNRACRAPYAKPLCILS